uniref:Filamin B n=1 Tax=Oryzias latipes TaxID=8090 RepID=A0A3P9KPJ2_ORYLA
VPSGQAPCEDQNDGSCDVRYWPTEPGEYAIRVTCDEEDIELSPFMTCLVCGAENAGKGPLTITAQVRTDLSPSQRAVPCNVRPQAGRADASVVRYTPTEEGVHAVKVSYDGHPVPGSPFPVEASLSILPFASQVKAFGPGLEGGLVGNPAEFTIDTTGAGTGGLGLTVEGPTEAKIECSDNGDGTCSVSYLPTEPGDYLVNILFENAHVPGSPFRADIQMPFDPSKVVASGSGLKRAKVRGRLPERGSCSLLPVPVCPSSDGDAPLCVPGRKAKTEVISNNDGTFTVTYVPTTAGMYTLLLKYGDQTVPGFPAKVPVDPAVDTSKVKVFGPGLFSGKPPRRSRWTPEGAGIGGLGITVEGPSESKMSCKDNKDGSCSVEYVPFTPGLYDVNITYGGEHIPGESRLANGHGKLSAVFVRLKGPQPPSEERSPFKVQVKDIVDPSKVKVSGPGVGSGVRANIPQSFTVDCRKAGVAPLAVAVTDPDGNPKQPRIHDNGGGTYLVSYIPDRTGRYTIVIKYGGDDIPASPFRVRATATGDAKRNDTEVVENPDGTFDIFYTAPAPGNYVIFVRFGGENIPRSPFKVMVRTAFLPLPVPSCSQHQPEEPFPKRNGRKYSDRLHKRRRWFPSCGFVKGMEPFFLLRVQS